LAVDAVVQAFYTFALIRVFFPWTVRYVPVNTRTSAVRSIIDCSIAVIVQTIAMLHAFLLRIAAPRAALAAIGSVGSRAQRVDGMCTVVLVGTVLPASIYARFLGTAANADLLAAGRRHGYIVDHTVAVVVEAVA
jgi:hypothetical protein